MLLTKPNRKIDSLVFDGMTSSRPVKGRGCVFFVSLSCRGSNLDKKSSFFKTLQKLTKILISFLVITARQDVQFFSLCSGTD